RPGPEPGRCVGDAWPDCVVPGPHRAQTGGTDRGTDATPPARRRDRRCRRGRRRGAAPAALGAAPTPRGARRAPPRGPAVAQSRVKQSGRYGEEARGRQPRWLAVRHVSVATGDGEPHPTIVGG